MTTEIREQIGRLVAGLHGLYRADSTDDYHTQVEGLKEQFAVLTSLKPPDRRGTRRTRGTIPGIVTTRDETPLYKQLEGHIHASSVVRIASAFLSAAETNPLLLPLEKVCDSKGTVRIMTSLMGLLNRPGTLRAFCEWGPRLEFRIYAEDPCRPEELLRTTPPGFHAKAMLFEKMNAPHALAVGSANFTSAGLGTNIEWTYLSDFETNSIINGEQSPYQHAVQLFDQMWDNHGYRPDASFISEYEALHRETESLRRRMFGRVQRTRKSVSNTTDTEIRPRSSQHEALKRMASLRTQGVQRYAVIAATGLGKTYLSAFDVKQTDFSRVLFIAHRELILKQARMAYARVLPGIAQILLQGSDSVSAVPPSGPVHVFAMVQTLGRPETLKRLVSDAFDYVVVDEFHHAAASQYRAILQHFSPKVLLGLTATPERRDGQDVLEHCGHTVAYEVRLFDAVDRGWLAPFQYHALPDPDDYSHVRWTGTGYDEQQLEEALSTDTRADLIVKNLHRYQPAEGKLKCLAFCSNVGHARWMADAFEVRGIKAVAVVAETPENERQDMIQRLGDDDDPLQILCAVDVLTEGIDIPLLTHVLMLRPTESITVFIQQLGRGLRLHPAKPFLTVLDFVGNFERSYVAPLALQGIHTATVSCPSRVKRLEFRVPAGCHIGVDTEVEKIWRENINALSRKSVPPIKQLETLLLDLSRDETGRTHIEEVRLPDLFLLSDDEDVASDSARIPSLIRKCGGWLSVRVQLTVATEYEKTLIGSPGAELLSHIELNLKRSRSYKMTVLMVLLDTGDGRDSPPMQWTVLEIAEGFLERSLNDRRRLRDWPDLSRASDPASFPISRVESHIKKMPLDKLSNESEKPFELDKSAGMFRLKPPFQPYWRDPRFRKLVRERVEYVDARYWYRNRSE